MNLYPFWDAQGLVLDCGSSMWKVGFSGDDAPRAVFPSIIGYPKDEKVKKTFCGDNATLHEKISTIHRTQPWDGSPPRYDDIEKLLQYSFSDELRVRPSEHPVLLCSFQRMDSRTYEKLGEILFEKYSVPGGIIVDSCVLSLMASGRITGTVLESGHGITKSVAIAGCFPLLRSLQRMERPLRRERRISGDVITDYLVNLLKQKKDVHRKNVEDIKAKFCYVALDYGEELQKKENLIQKVYELPGGDTIMVGNERFRAPEILFRPNLVRPDERSDEKLVGIHEMIQKTISSCNLGLRRDLYCGIVCSGGSTMFPGFSERLTRELESISPLHSRPRVICPPERKYSAWIGGSIFSCLSTCVKEWLRKADYFDLGEKRVMKHHSVRCLWEKNDFELLRMRKVEDIDLTERIEFCMNSETQFDDTQKGEIVKLKEIKLSNQSLVVHPICVFVMWRIM